MPENSKSQMKGRAAMSQLMKMKDAHNEAKRNCLAKGSCPEYLPYASEDATPCVDGFANGWPCDKVDLLAFIDWTDLGFDNEDIIVGNDMWVWHDTEMGDDYALMGANHGTSFIRITDPVAPEVLGILRTHTGNASQWRDMKVVNDHAYIVSEALDHGMQVFDLTRLRGLSAVSPVPEFESDAHYAGFGHCHNIAANTELQKVYAIGATVDGPGHNLCEGGLHIVDVSEPKNPRFSDCIGFDGYVHDTECIVYDGPDTRYTGNEICFGYNEDSLTVYNVGLSEFGFISRVAYEGSRYTHQGWVTEDPQWLLLDDELDEVVSTVKNTKTYVWNIEDLQNPVLTWTYLSAEEAIDHNMYIVGDYAYQTNYEAGLRILHINGETGELTEVAYFDVFPSRTTAEFAGSWSNYPWLPNNVVGVSSIDYGFFLVRVDMAAIEQEMANRTKKGEMHRYLDTVYGKTAGACPTLVERKECEPVQC
uniref:Regulatory P domain-containing protein n=1 Tax=Spirobranchus lamarcki TaxID=2082999 RepID=D2WL88_SPILA|nr:regulatory P domain-containing protein [Spirobranchus lamarcki]